MVDDELTAKGKLLIRFWRSLQGRMHRNLGRHIFYITQMIFCSTIRKKMVLFSGSWGQSQGHSKVMTSRSATYNDMRWQSDKHRQTYRQTEK